MYIRAHVDYAQSVRIRRQTFSIQRRNLSCGRPKSRITRLVRPSVCIHVRLFCIGPTLN